MRNFGQISVSFGKIAFCEILVYFAQGEIREISVLLGFYTVFYISSLSIINGNQQHYTSLKGLFVFGVHRESRHEKLSRVYFHYFT